MKLRGFCTCPRNAIRNYLWDENKGLPVSYGEPEIEAKTDAVLAHLMMQARNGGAEGFRA